MCTLMTSIFVLLLSCALGSRQRDTLDQCNYIADTDPDDGTYLGWYAINKATPKDYCNYYNVYSDNTASSEIIKTPPNPAGPPAITGPPLNGTLAWWYACNAQGDVDKYFCWGGGPDCNTCTPYKARTYNTSMATFNCQDVNGDCLFEWTMYLDVNDYGAAPPQPKCNIDRNKILRKAYQVNGGCQPQGPDNYGLMVCNDPPVLDQWNGESIGYTNEQYTNDTCRTGGTGYDYMRTFDITTNEYACGGQWSIQSVNGPVYGVFEVDQCTGKVDEGPNYNPNGAIDNLGSPCGACTSKLDTCAADVTCEHLIDYLLFRLPNCTQTFEAINEGIVDGLWCNASALNIDCDGIGFTDAYDCITDNECYIQLAPATDDDCNCDYEPCIMDATCKYIISTVQFDDNPNLFDDIFNVCNAPSLPDGNATDCTILQDIMRCGAMCDSNDENNDDCMANLTISMFDCAFTPACYAPFSATLTSFFETCDQELCAPSDLTSTHDTYCSSNNCSDPLYNTLYTAVDNCINSECVWANCETAVDNCIAVAECKEELDFIINIENKYDVGGDDDFMGYVKTRYCAKRPNGDCHSLLNAAYNCAVTYHCLDLQHDTCWERNCTAEVAACNDNVACIDTLIYIIGNQTACEQNISATGQRMDTVEQYCPARCDDLDMNAYTECGTAKYHDGMLYGDEATQLSTYYSCQSACEACDEWLDIGRGGCGSGDCDNAWNELMVCIISKCPDEEDDDDAGSICFSEICTEESVNCLFDNDCYQDWQWVEQYFQTFKERQDIATEKLFEYDTEVKGIAGCSIDDLEADNKCGSGFQFGESTNCQQAAWQCYYYDIHEYCKDTTNNVDGCSITFWNMLNCNLKCQWDTLDTITPTTAPSRAPSRATKAPSRAPSRATKAPSRVPSRATKAPSQSSVNDTGGGNAMEIHVVMQLIMVAIFAILFN